MGFSQFQEDTLFTSGRRVEFDIPIDESLHQAALTLHSNKVAKVYNGSIEIANYCAYFTPDVKCGMDLRFGLFAPRAAEYAALRNDLIDSFVESFGGKSTRHAKAGDAKAAANKTVGDWGIEALAFANFRPVTQAAMNNTNLLVTFLLRQPSHWKPTLVDGQSTVFLHERNIVSPDLDLLAQFNRQAFGPLPQAKWLPNRPAELPPSGANWADLYVRGPGHIPLDNSTARFQLDAYQHLSGAWVAPYFVASQAMNSLAAAAPALGGQGPMVGVQAKVSIDLGGLFFRTPSRGEPTSFRGRDPGPPGLPVLIHREMRRSVEKNPQIPSSYFQLANAIRLNMRQEGWWSGHPEPTLLYQLRQVELIAALRNAVNLAPDNVEYQRQLGDALMSQNLLDSALVHFTEASRLLDEAPIGEASLRKYFPGEYDKIVNAAREKAARKKADDGSVDLDVRSMARDHFDRVRDQMRKFVKIREVDVKRRKDDLDLKAAGADDMMRFHLAFRAPYTVTDMENNRREDPRGRGLALEAIKALERAKFTTTDKKNEEQVKREKAVRDINLVRLYCLQGQVQEAVQAYSRAKAEDPNFENVDIIAMIGAATGWYENVDHAMAHLQDEAKQALVQQAPLVRDVAVLALGLNQLADESTVGRIARGITIENLIFARTRLMNQAKAGAAEYAAVRGIYLMEQGDTAAALKAFDDALSSDLLFLDRPIAERYRELLKQEWK